MWAAGVRALLAALTVDGNSLISLNLFHNCIGGPGAKALAAALPSCPSLRSLNVACNPLSQQG